MALWLSKEELMSKPVSGPGWDAVKAAAASSWGTANLSDQNSMHNVLTLAGAYVATRTSSTAMLRKTRSALASIPGTEKDGRVLALGRNLAAYMIAADTVGYRDSKFVSWVKQIRTEQLSNEPDKGTDSLISRHESRANNWGVCCGMSRIAVALYLKDQADLERCVVITKGWLGDRSSYSDFFYGPKGAWESWSHDPAHPVPVNPVGTVKDGISLDGAMPADQYRGGQFKVPPPCDVHPAGTAGFILTTIEMLRKNGYPQCHTWSDNAGRRVQEWLHAFCPLDGNDLWQPYLARRLWPNLDLPGGSAKAKGTNMAWCAWSHG